MSVLVDIANYIGDGWTMGNQFFQIANGYAFAKKTGRKLILPASNINPHYERYGVPYKYNNWFASWLPYVGNIPPGRVGKYKEPHHAFREITDAPFDTIILDGYFQSSKYFSSCKDEVRELFQPTDEIRLSCQEKYGHFMMGDPNFVLVHARRTDYLKPQNIAIHNPLPAEYYYNAFNEIKNRVKNPFYILVSDDPTFWQTIKIPGNYTIIDEPDAATTLYFLTHFKNYIIANSTFSWWGAFLSKHSNPLVLAPEKWFGPAGPQDYQDMYEADWIKIGQV
jgi:hypothetical protein